MVRNLNVMGVPGSAERFKSGDVLELPVVEAQAWLAAGWTSIVGLV